MWLHLPRSGLGVSRSLWMRSLAWTRMSPRPIEAMTRVVCTGDTKRPTAMPSGVMQALIAVSPPSGQSHRPLRDLPQPLHLLALPRLRQALPAHLTTKNTSRESVESTGRPTKKRWPTWPQHRPRTPHHLCRTWTPRVAALSLPLALRSPLTGRLSLAMTAGSAGESQSSAPMRAHGARHCQRILLNGLSLERLFLLP